MRVAYGFLALSMAGLCGAVALPQDDSPTAEKVFKNIKSFNGDKASDIIPAMRFMCASLKTDCAFCHTEDRASDEKRPKETARAMIAMQRDINKRNFGGRNQVTCATCHGGHIRPISVPPVAGSDVRPQRSQTVKADDVLSAYAKAVGTSTAAATSGIELRGTDLTGGVKSSLEVNYAGGKFTIVSKSPKGEQRQGFNGTLAWFSTPNGIQSVPLVYAAAFVNQKVLYMGPDTLPKLTNTTGGTAQIAGKDNLVVTGTMADKTRVSLFFDQKTGLLTRTMFSYPSILGSTPQINDYSDYRKVNGILIPTTVENHATGVDSVVQFKSIKGNDKVDAAMFDPPKS